MFGSSREIDHLRGKERGRPRLAGGLITFVRRWAAGCARQRPLDVQTWSRSQSSRSPSYV